MRSILAAAIGLAILLPASAEAKPDVCKRHNVAKTIKGYGKPILEGVQQLLCADVTGDGQSDAVFTLASGGTAGPTAYGVIEGPASSLLLYEDQAYGASIDVVNDRRFDVQEPILKKHDANCCPSSFVFTPYRFRGDTFVPGKAHHYKKAKQRFYDR